VKALGHSRAGGNPFLVEGRAMSQLARVSSGILFFFIMTITVGPICVRAEERAKPLVFAHYYTWYTTGYGPNKNWGQWSHLGPSEFYPNGCDPERILFSPSIREISSCAYPLAGPYDSDNREVVRWHIRLAKAAGIDAFSVDWWGDAHWQNPKSWTRHVFEDVVLPVAEEEDFKVFLFDETAEFYKDLDEVADWSAKALVKYATSPAYLRLDGKPVFAIYQRWSGRMSQEECRTLMDSVERNAKLDYYLRFLDVAVQNDGQPIITTNYDNVIELLLVTAAMSQGRLLQTFLHFKLNHAFEVLGGEAIKVEIW